jgi:hypothetical protein
MPNLSMRAYARHRAVALAAVQKAIESARISLAPNGTIDPELADRQWENNTRLGPPAILKPAQNTNNRASDGASQYTEARAERERYVALRAQLEYEQRAAKLVNIHEVQAEVFNAFRELRDRVLNVPDRVSALLASESDPAKINQILAAEIRSALQEFAGPPNVQAAADQAQADQAQ